MRVLESLQRDRCLILKCGGPGGSGRTNSPRSIYGCSGSVVAFEDDLFAVPAVGGQLFTNAGDHVVEAADVGVDVEFEVGGKHGGVGRWHGQGDAETCGAFFNDAGYVILHIAAKALPTLVGAAERGQVVEVRFAGGEGFEFFAVVKFAFVAGAVDHPDFLASLRSMPASGPV